MDIYEIECFILMFKFSMLACFLFFNQKSLNKYAETFVNS